MQNTTLVVFLSITLASLTLVSYGMYLYFGAYNLIDKFEIIMMGEPQIENSSSPNFVSVTASFLFINPSAFPVRLAYVSETLYLNGQKLGDEALTFYDQPIRITPNVTVSITIQNIPVGKVSGSSKTWNVELTMILFDMPLTDRGYFSRSFSYPI